MAASETPPCGVTRESVWGWVVDLRSTCSCTTASSPVRRCCGRQYISTPSIHCSLVTHCLGTSRLAQHRFFPWLTSSRSHETQKVKSLKQKKKKPWTTQKENDQKDNVKTDNAAPSTISGTVKRFTSIAGIFEFNIFLIGIFVILQWYAATCCFKILLQRL